MRALALALGLLGLMADPAAAASLWGYSGLGLMPSGEVLRPGEYATGAHVAAFSGDTLVPLHLTAGVLEGLEMGLTYPGRLGGASNVAGNVTFQLVRSNRDNPTRVAIGLTNLGVGTIPLAGNLGESFVSGNNLFMVISRDFNAPINGQLRTMVSGYLGFTGAATAFPFVNLDSRVMLGMEVPLLQSSSLYAEYMGPAARSGQFVNLGGRFEPFPGLEIQAATLGQPGQSFLERAYVAGVAYKGQWPALLAASNQLATRLATLSLAPPPEQKPPAVPQPKALSGETAPIAATKLPPPPQIAPPPAPLATLYGKVTTSGGIPVSNAQVGLLERLQWRQTTTSGAFFLAAVPRGTYTLAVQDTGGRVIASRSVDVPGDGPVQADLQLSAARSPAEPATH